MNVLYLLNILNTNKLSELVANIDLPLVDINLSIWDAEEQGLIKVDHDKDKVQALTEDYELTAEPELQDKILRVMHHYERQNTNITRGRLNLLFKSQQSDYNYRWHDYLMALQYLIDSKQVITETITVPEIKNKRPYHKFVFLSFPTNLDKDWNKTEVENWKKNFTTKKKK